jgi:hypothetical protein
MGRLSFLKNLFKSKDRFDGPTIPLPKGSVIPKPNTGKGFAFFDTIRELGEAAELMLSEDAREEALQNMEDASNDNVARRALKGLSNVSDTLYSTMHLAAKHPESFKPDKLGYAFGLRDNPDTEMNREMDARLAPKRAEIAAKAKIRKNALLRAFNPSELKGLHSKAIGDKELYRQYNAVKTPEEALKLRSDFYGEPMDSLNLRELQGLGTVAKALGSGSKSGSRGSSLKMLTDTK